MLYLSILIGFSVIYWFIFKNILIWLINSWIYNPFYKHGFIIFFICLGFLIYNGLKIKNIRVNPKQIFWWIIAIVIAFFGYYFKFRYLTACAYSFFVMLLLKALLIPPLHIMLNFL